MSVELKRPAPVERPAPDPEAYALECALRSLVHIGAVTSERSRQRAIGASGVGELCARQLAHRAAGTRPSNVPDPLRALIGTGVHSAMAGLLVRLDAGSGRFLVEHPVRYRGVPGTVDLFDRLTGTVVDWKTAHLAKLRHVQQSGPPSHYVVQLQIYGAALAAAGETVRALALAYVPLDGTLDELWVWRTTPDPRAADAAINRLNAIVGAELESVARPDPSTVEASPSALCRWCPYYLPGVMQLADELSRARNDGVRDSGDTDGLHGREYRSRNEAQWAAFFESLAGRAI